jgi:hypothetical protein
VTELHESTGNCSPHVIGRGHADPTFHGAPACTVTTNPPGATRVNIRPNGPF